MPTDLLDGQAAQAMPWIPTEAITDLEAGKAYSLAWILDPLISDKLQLSLPPTQISFQRQIAMETNSYGDTG